MVKQVVNNSKVSAGGLLSHLAGAACRSVGLRVCRYGSAIWIESLDKGFKYILGVLNCGFINVPDNITEGLFIQSLIVYLQIAYCVY